MDFQTIIATLHAFWRERGCAVLEGYDLEKGAATLGPQTFLRAPGPAPCAIAYVDACRRPGDSRFGRDRDRLQRYYQYQVLLKPAPGPEAACALFVDSLRRLGVDPAVHDLRFIDDTWESPVFGAMGHGWEVWLDGVEIAQLTYFETCGGVPCEARPLEVTYGLERLAMRLQETESFAALRWGAGLTYGDVHGAEEQEFSAYNLDVAPVGLLKRRLMLEADEIAYLAEVEMVYPTLDALLRWSHVFNVLDARGAFAPEERAAHIGRVRGWARTVVLAHLARDNYEAARC